MKCAWLVGPKNAGRGTWSIRGTADALQMAIPVGLAQGRKFVAMRAALTRWFRGDLRLGFEAVVEAVEVVAAMSKCHNERCKRGSRTGGWARCSCRRAVDRSGPSSSVLSTRRGCRTGRKRCSNRPCVRRSLRARCPRPRSTGRSTANKRTRTTRRSTARSAGGTSATGSSSRSTATGPATRCRCHSLDYRWTRG